MTAQILIIGFVAIEVLLDIVLDVLADNQRKVPLPESVADVYDADKYAEYFAYVSEGKKASTVYGAIDAIVLIAVLFSGFFVVVDEFFGGNVYLVAVATFFPIWAISAIERTILSYYLTFFVDDRYGLNKLDRKGFAKDTAITELPSLVLALALLLFFVFVGENLPVWSDGFDVGLAPAIGICAAIVVGTIVILAVAAALSVFTMMKRYTFTPMPASELRSDIEKLIEGSRKKIRQIYVYDESSKSTEKNAFLLSLFGYRFFGVADNFVNENSQRELLAVLSHEVGHLKHRRNAWNYGMYVIYGVLFAVAVAVIVNPGPILFLVDWTQESFGIKTLNYVLILSVLGIVSKPFYCAVQVYSNCMARLEEYEADCEAVRNGYEYELEETLKHLERDELMTVNPHPLIEFLEYDHPGLANRIAAMREAAVKKDGAS